METFIAIISTAIIIFYSLFQPTKPVLIGAYYYPWWGEKHWTKYPVSGLPLLGKYFSSDPKVNEQHIKWAKEAGVDFFLLSWNGKDGSHEFNIQNGFLKAKNINQIKFAIFYESRSCLSRKIPIDFNDPQIAQKLIDDFNYLADTHFKHHSYFKINGRPVVVIYLTRIFAGDYWTTVEIIRENLKKKGFNIYLIGDQIWWNPPPQQQIIEENGKQILKIPWDALTAYNLYYPTFKNDKITNIFDFSQKIKAVYQNWRKFLNPDSTEKENFQKGADLIPGIFPQYDDFKLRKNPPLLASGPDDFKIMLETAKEVATPIGPKKQKIILITSWNEWHEGTSIEPGKMNFEDDFLLLKTLKEWQEKL